MKSKDMALERRGICGKTFILLVPGAFVLFLMSSAVFAQQAGHAPLVKSSAVDFNKIFEHALNNAPEILERDVRQKQARSFEAIAGNWITDRPNLVVSYLEDRMLGDIGQREFEYAIQLQLRRPGERKSSRLLSDSYQEQIRAWEKALELYIAGRVRNSLADIAEADTRLTLEQETTRNTERLLEITNKLVDAGELAKLDVMQAETLLLNQRQIELETEALLVDAERSYEVLTGLHVRPNYIYTEKLTDQNEIDHSHPQLVHLQSDIKLAEANIQMTQADARGAPVLSLGVTSQRDDSLQQDNEAIALSLSIPFGARDIVASRTSMARRTKVDAEVIYQNTLRQLELTLHEVEHELFLTTEAIALAEQKSLLSEKRWQMTQTAFIQGEVSLTQVIQSLQEYQQAQKQCQLLALNKERLITEFNQTIGIMP